MSLEIYTAADPDTALSQDGDHTSDFLVSLDGKLGGVLQKKLYVRNTDSAVRHTGIALTVDAPESGSAFLDDSAGYSWLLYEGDTQPTDTQWEEILDIPNTIDLGDLGAADLPDTTTYLPFWVRVEIPRNADVRTFTDIRFKLTGQEILI